MITVIIDCAKCGENITRYDSSAEAERIKPGMTWENYGTVWEIDHKIPVAVFNFERPGDLDFRLYWSLKNLRPLEAKENNHKQDKLDNPYQPALLIAG